MRMETFTGNVSRYFVQRQCPWAAKIVKVSGGYAAFESINDWKTWKKATLEQMGHADRRLLRF